MAALVNAKQQWRQDIMRVLPNGHRIGEKSPQPPEPPFHGVQMSIQTDSHVTIDSVTVLLTCWVSGSAKYWILAPVNLVMPGA